MYRPTDHIRHWKMCHVSEALHQSEGSEEFEEFQDQTWTLMHRPVFQKYVSFPMQYVSTVYPLLR